MVIIDEHSVQIFFLNLLLISPIIGVILLDPRGPGFITPIDEIFSLSISDIPEIDLEEWNLKITGNVASPQNFTYSQLLALPQSSQEVELQCVEGYYAYALWTGVSLKTLMDLVHVSSSVIDVVFFAADGYSSSLSRTWINPETLILAYEVNNQTLLPELGFPLRVVAPGQYGYKWVMWVSEIRFVDYDHIGYWENRGWMDNAQYETAERVFFPINWRIHALSLAVSFYCGAVALISGARKWLQYRDLLTLPKWVGSRFHLVWGIIYGLTLITSTGIWIARSIILKGSLDWNFHGIMATVSLGGFLGQIVGLIGEKALKTPPSWLKNPKQFFRRWHGTTGLVAMVSMSFAVISGFLFF